MASMAQRCPELGREIIVDADYFVKGVNELAKKDKMGKGDYGDLWELWFENEHDKPGNRITKIKSHAEATVLGREMDLPRFVRNSVADVTPDAVAKTRNKPFKLE